MRNKGISLFAATVQYSVLSICTLKNICRCRDLKTVNKWLTLRYTVVLGATVLYKEEWRSGHDDETAKIWPVPAVHRCFELGDKGIKKCDLKTTVLSFC